MSKNQNKDFVLFDGYCNLCSSSVQFIIKRDTKNYFRFASLQSEEGKKFLHQFNLSGKFDKSLVLVEDNTFYLKSDAALRIAKKLKGLWPLFYAFIIVPRFIRDAVYMLISRNRFRWFGKRDTCFLPDRQ